MIIRDTHECTGTGGHRNDDGTADHRDKSDGETELQEARGGAAGALPGVLYESGE